MLKDRIKDPVCVSLTALKQPDRFIQALAKGIWNSCEDKKDTDHDRT